jgi:hypothetical protein
MGSGKILAGANTRVSDHSETDWSIQKMKINRRQFIEKGSVGVAAASSVHASFQEATQEDVKPVRIGVVGLGPRGRRHIKNLLEYQQGVVVPAICDYREERAAQAAALVKDLKGYTPTTYTKGPKDYLNLLERDDLNGILVAADVFANGTISIDSMKAGKHVGIEIAGCHTIEECYGVVEEQKRSGKQCMLLGNCCYGDKEMTIYNMVRKGAFGEPYFAVGSYVHDLRFLLFEDSGQITWRGKLVRDTYGSTYPQHGLGPCCKWLGINDGDRMEYCQSMQTTARETHAWLVERFGPDSEQAEIRFKTGDFVTTLISTAKGKNIRIDYSISNTRPYSRYYLLQGMKGCWDSRTGFYIAPADQEEWKSLKEYVPEYQHHYWRKDGEMAQISRGNEGIDFFCIYDFVKMVRTEKQPWIDVYDTASWSSIIHCTKLSLDRKGALVPMPDFTNGKWKDPGWREQQAV